jgi:3-oxoacyl-[acyl-carrier-protein] synthase II
VKRAVVITGVGLVTPLGANPEEVLQRLQAGETVAAPPVHFDASPFSCPVCAEVKGFDPEQFVPDPKTVRLMNRDGLFAAAAARLALDNARLAVGKDYAGEEIALFGATGLAGMRLDEVAPLIRHSAAADGGFDARRFGSEALKRIRPILSFKILSNMPICFVSIFEGIRGPNTIYNPWEGQGARAIGRGIAAVRRGEAPCALVGGCDAKAHALAFTSLEEAGVFRSWREQGQGAVPGEGAAFLVLEAEDRARARGVRILARAVGAGFCTVTEVPHGTDASARPFGATAARETRLGSTLETFRTAVAGTGPGAQVILVSGEEGDGLNQRAEEQALQALGITAGEALRPKVHAGNLFAAAAALQVGLAATLASAHGAGAKVLAACFGHGSEQAAFLLEGVGEAAE